MRNNAGNPCIVMPTGSGKSWVVAGICKDAVHKRHGSRALVLSHVQEIIEQDVEKIRALWPGAPVGVCCAGLKKREIEEPITVASIQSIAGAVDKMEPVNVVLIDECHLVNHRQEGVYRTVINKLLEKNSKMRCIGLTATPFRLGHGSIASENGLFNHLIEPVSILELIGLGALAPLRSKRTEAKLDVSSVGKRGGEYREGELQEAVDTSEQNALVVDETIAMAEDRKSWLFFCTGVDHAHHLCELLRERGIAADVVTGKTPRKERVQILERFKAGKLRALCNCQVLTTGFDYPGIDLIAMVRPTLSASLYVQMCGRGLRPKPHTDHCLVLDFAGNVAQHGPITSVSPPPAKGERAGQAVTKECEGCGEIVHASVRECPECGFQFPPPAPPPLHLRDDDIMGIHPSKIACKDWQWKVHVGYRSGKLMLMVRYYGPGFDPPVVEYLPILNDGWGGNKARGRLVRLLRGRATLPESGDMASLEALCATLNASPCPDEVEFFREGKFFRVTRVGWWDQLEMQIGNAQHAAPV